MGTIVIMYRTALYAQNQINKLRAGNCERDRLIHFLKEFKAGDHYQTIEGDKESTFAFIDKNKRHDTN